MKADAKLLLAKYDIPYQDLTQMKGGATNISWHLDGTEFLLRVANPVASGDSVLIPLQAAVHLQQLGLHTVTPAFPTVLSVVTEDGRRVNGTLWFFEEASDEPLDYRQLGELIRLMQDQGADAIRRAGLVLPGAMDSGELRQDLELLKEWEAVTPEEYKLLHNWIPRIERSVDRLPASPDVLAHDDLWPKNLIMSKTRGLVLCDLDDLSWARPEYDLGFITRARQEGLISKEQVADFEAGYEGKIPDINTAWRLSLFHRFRWVCHLLERRDVDPDAAATLRTELPLWRRRRGPQPS